MGNTGKKAREMSWRACTTNNDLIYFNSEFIIVFIVMIAWGLTCNSINKKFWTLIFCGYFSMGLYSK